MSSSSSSSSSLPPSPPPLPLSNPDPSTITGECWASAEQLTQEILYRVQPTVIADQKRNQVIDYVQRLIQSFLVCEVFPYGSVPLKTYLPDGDIDLTALSSPNVDAALASDVRAALEAEEHNELAEYEVKDVQFIDAEVKLVKCLVQDIVVDISFNQLGGLCTLCFLEQVDRLIGKDHLFKRSIILIKAWCYYESRILGAHHGLISTYALETLVLYIFHLFHSSLNGPLAVLYRFLDYFSGFDWDNYCISLNGPVCKASLPYILAELPENEGHDLLLSEEFLRYCMDTFSVPSRGFDTESRAFPLKHLNIIDPLKESNNLGRSVYRGNFYRIRSAFKYGARKLGWILTLPEDRIAYELKVFFTNTLERNEYVTLLVDDGKIKNVNLRQTMPASSNTMVEADSLIHLGSTENHLVACSSIHSCNDHEGLTSICSAVSSPVAADVSEFSFHAFREGDIAGVASSAEELTSLLDLSGDCDSDFWSPLYGQTFHGYAPSAHVPPSPPVSPSQLRNKNPWDNVYHSQMTTNGASPPLSPSRLRNKNPGDNVCHSLQSKQNFHSQMNTNGSILKSHHHENRPTLPSAAVNSDKQKARGTGTYFPNTNYRPRRVRPSLGRGRNQTAACHAQVQKHTSNNGLVTALPEGNLFEEVSHEPSQAQHSVLGRAKCGSSDCHQSQSSMKGSSHSNGFSLSSETLEFGNLGPRSHADSGNSWGSAPSRVASLLSSLQGPKPVASNNSERTEVEAQKYHLKDQNDFPPLSLNIFGRTIRA